MKLITQTETNITLVDNTYTIGWFEERDNQWVFIKATDFKPLTLEMVTLIATKLIDLQGKTNKKES